MGKITRIEDITNIVGIKNYIAALQLDLRQLEYISYHKKNKGLNIEFKYQDCCITISMNKNKSIYDMTCTCQSGTEYCSHEALTIMYLLKNDEFVEDMLLNLNSEFDEEFNENLFSTLATDYLKKECVQLEVILKNGVNDYNYELQIKIGTERKYVLTKRIEELLKVIKQKEGTVEFGKSFTFDAEKHYFDSKDQKIIDFLELYVDSQVDSYGGYYGYYSRSTIRSVELTGRTLLTFLELLKDKTFSINEGYYTYKFNGIKEFNNLDVELENIKDKLKIKINYHDMQPITKNYEYIIINEKIYHCENNEFIKFLKTNQKRELVFKEEEFSKVANYILPTLNKVSSKNDLLENLNSKFSLKEPTVKYYFDLHKNKIECTIKLEYEDAEQNIMDFKNQLGDMYIIRDYKKENTYYEAIMKWGFAVNNETKSLVVEKENQLIEFMENGLKELTENYAVYISKRLQDFKIIRNTQVRSEFGIGKDNILSFQFKLDGINQKEIDNIMTSMKEKKKYYQLKNGSWLDLEENSELENLGKMIAALDISKQDLLKEKIPISKYKSLEIEQLNNEYDFVKIDNQIENIINKFKNYRDLDIKYSKEDKKLLRDYQQIGIKWMLTIAECEFGGILADEMGLGKSLQTIRYLDKRKEKNSGIKSLIVVPTSLIYNWENEFKKFSPSMRYAIVNDTKEKREHILKEINNYDILITTYGLLRQDIDYYEQLDFDTCIIDEAQNIKNVNTETTKAVKRIKAKNKFALTGTPIENSLLELWSIFDFCMPGFLPNVTKFKKTYSIKNLEEDYDLLNDLKEKISPFILRRRKKDVLKDLPDKIENNIFVELNDEQKSLYVANLEKTKKEINDTIKTDGFMKSQILILSLLTKLRQICIDPRLIVENNKMTSSKIETLVDIVKQTIENGHKILIFSQFPSALRIVKADLEKENVYPYYLDGSTKSKERMRLVTEFNQNNVPVFLISLKAGGTGLNLTSADVVIHLDPWWNPQVENQATDRSHRIGQKNVVEVIKLIAKGTIEEKIVELQNKKKMLSDQMIEKDSNSEVMLSKLTEKELRDILNS